MTKFLTPETRFQSYMIFPRFLLECPISETAKLLYVLLLDRARISVKSEEWIDRHGHVFLNFTITDMAKALHKSEMTVKNCLNALEKEDLIARKRQGTGKPNRIYVKIQGNEAAMGISESIHETDRETPEEEMQADNQAEKAEAINRERELSVKGAEKCFPGGQRTVYLKDRDLSARKTEDCLRDTQETVPVGDRNLSSKEIKSCPHDRQETVSYGDRKLSGNKNKIIKITEKERERKTASKAYGIYQNVYLSDTDVVGLKKDINHYEEYVDRLSEYMEMTGKRYRNHAATVRHWAARDREEKGLRNYECREGESL